MPVARDIHAATLTSLDGSWSAPVARGVTYVFGCYELRTDRHVLLENEIPVRVGSRALALLFALVEQAGHVVTKAELIRAAWPDTFVEDVSLRVHIAALRRILQDDGREPVYIANVAGRGYRFVADVEQRLRHSVPRRAPPAIGPPNASFEQVNPRGFDVIGVEAVVERVIALVRGSRLVTLVGPAGVGKTTLALEALKRLSLNFSGGAYSVDVSNVVSSYGLEDILRAAIERDGDTEGADDYGRRSRRILLVDGCDAIVDVAATAIENLLRGRQDLHVLATSVEILGVESEQVYRVEGLATPQSELDQLDFAKDVDGTFPPALSLLLRHATAVGLHLATEPDDLRRLGLLCRRLDGNPMAIELAVAHIAANGLEGLEAQLSASGGAARRGANDDQTLAALARWQIQSLSPEDARILARLSVFCGSFTISAACSVACDATLSPERAVDSLRSLLHKSMLTASLATTPRRFKISEMVRNLARVSLAETGEEITCRLRHARAIYTILSESALDHASDRHGDWELHIRPWRSDVLAALETLNDACDAELYCRLATRALQLGLSLGGPETFRAHLETALQSAHLVTLDTIQRARMALALFDQAMTGTDRSSAVPGLKSPKESRAEGRLRTDSLLVSSASALLENEPARARSLALAALERARATNEPGSLRAAEAALAAAEHRRGQHESACEIAKRLLAQPAPAFPFAEAPWGNDLRIGMRISMAVGFWITGQADRARLAVADAMNHAPRQGPLAICQTLALAAVPILIWCGDDVTADRHTRQLADIADRSGLTYWQTWARLHEDALNLQSFREGRGHRVVRLPTLTALQRQTWCTFTGNCYSGHIEEQSWCGPELIRLEGHRRLRDAGELAIPDARKIFLRAMGIARQQRALGWQLRSAISLARLQDSSERDLDLLSATIALFSEGFSSSDLIVARSMLRDSGSA